MKRMRCFAVMMLVLGCVLSGIAQEKMLYKQIDSDSLYLEMYTPPQIDSARVYPAMVFFFGGGWVGGDRHHFLNHAKYFSQRGLICFLADYRTHSRHQTTPFESLKDAKSAVRFIRKNAASLCVNPNKLIASGGSAGGHLAAATALIDGFNDSSDDLSVSCVPNALVLFNPVFDNGPGGYGYERVGDAYPFFSPLHNIKRGAPPTLILLGTQDKLIPVETAQYYQVVMQKVGSRCDLKLYKGQGHGFFNYDQFENYQNTVAEADSFLQCLGYLRKGLIVLIE